MKDFVTPREREIMEHVDRLCEEGHLMPTPKVFVMVGDECDPDAFVQKSNSWVRNGWNAMMQLMTRAVAAGSHGAGSVTVRDTAGANKTGAIFLGGWYIEKLMVGTSGDPEVFDSHNLVSPVSSGLSNLNVGSGTVTYNAASKKMQVTLPTTFSNTSAAPITIREVGLQFWAAGFNGVIMGSRDILASPKILNPTESTTITYLFEQTYPA